MNITTKHSLILGLLIVFVMFSVFATSGIAAGADVKINLAQYQTGPEFPGYRIAEYFKSRVDELSGGRIEINHFAGDLLGDWETQEIHVKEGSLNMCKAPASSTFDLEMEFVRMPYVIFNWEGAKNVYGPGGGGEQLLNEICQRNNTYCLGVEPEGFIVVVSTKEFTPLPGHESIGKLKTRVMPAKIEEISGGTLGFLTLSMSWGEIHSALMLGTIDAAMGPCYGEAPLFKDVVKKQYNYNYGFAAAPWIINLDLWNNLSEEDQGILQTAMTEAIGREWDRGTETEETAMAEMREAGVDVVYLTDEQMAANVEAMRDKVWSWAAENIYNVEFMDKIKSFAQPVN